MKKYNNLQDKLFKLKKKRKQLFKSLQRQWVKKNIGKHPLLKVCWSLPDIKSMHTTKLLEKELKFSKSPKPNLFAVPISTTSTRRIQTQLKVKNKHPNTLTSPKESFGHKHATPHLFRKTHTHPI